MYLVLPDGNTLELAALDFQKIAAYSVPNPSFRVRLDCAK